MKFAIISDIHSNLEALIAAFEEIDNRNIETVYCLGDIIGYGADPDVCVDLVRERCDDVIRGNHDEAAALYANLSYLPKDGQKAARHNRKRLTDEHVEYVAGLPYQFNAHNCTFVHASPQEPASWKRLASFIEAQNQFDNFETDVCFIGHTHIPAIISNKLGVLSVRRGYRYLINVGSVGQPRDFNPRLSFGIFDTETFTYENVRVPYDVERAAAKIKNAGLPRRLAKRLMLGE